MLSSLSRRSPETGPGVESGGGGGECRLSLKSVDSTETRAAVVDSLNVRVRVRVGVRVRVVLGFGFGFGFGVGVGVG